MPTWPSTTISTTNLDSGTDRPSLARADLKQMADVVNELVNYGAPTGNINFFLVASTLDAVTSQSSNAEQTIMTTNNSVNMYYNVTVSTTRWTFNNTGTYLCWCLGTANNSSGSLVPALRIQNFSTSVNEKSLGNFTSQEILFSFSATPFPLVVANTAHEYGFLFVPNNNQSTSIAYETGITLIGFKIA